MKAINWKRFGGTVGAVLLFNLFQSLSAEVAKVEADLNRERERLVKEHPAFFGGDR